MYDVYGSLDELESFTDAVDRYNRNMIIEFTSLFLSCSNHSQHDKHCTIFNFFPG